MDPAVLHLDSVACHIPERGKTTLIRMHFDAIHKTTKGLMVYLWMQWWFSESRQMDSKWNSTKKIQLENVQFHATCILYSTYQKLTKCVRKLLSLDTSEIIKEKPLYIVSFNVNPFTLLSYKEMTLIGCIWQLRKIRQFEIPNMSTNWCHSSYYCKIYYLRKT